MHWAGPVQRWDVVPSSKTLPVSGGTNHFNKNRNKVWWSYKGEETNVNKEKTSPEPSSLYTLSLLISPSAMALNTTGILMDSKSHPTQISPLNPGVWKLPTRDLDVYKNLKSNTSKRELSNACFVPHTSLSNTYTHKPDFLQVFPTPGDVASYLSQALKYWGVILSSLSFIPPKPHPRHIGLYFQNDLVYEFESVSSFSSTSNLSS